jgi:hypothetical protein
MRKYGPTRYIPNDSIAVEHPQGLGVAYVYRLGDRGYCVIAYGGKRNTSDFHYSYKTIEQAHEKIESWFKGLEQSQELKAKWRQERNKPHNFSVGDIVTNSWGYDQTNVDWYKVVRTTSHYVWLQPICAHVQENGFMSGPSVPHISTEGDDPKNWGVVEKGKVEMHHASGNNVSMKFGSGSKWDGKERYCSWYA